MNEDINLSELSGPEKPGRRKGKKETNVHRETYEWIQCVVVALVCCILIFVFFARVIDVSGPSMENTLQGGENEEYGYAADKIIITRLVSGYEQGDIVVLQKESFKEDAIVKRVIAVEGQTIDIDFDNGIVYVDGEALVEPYLKEGENSTKKAENFKGPVTVPEGCVFVMGDNRNHSTDSRDKRIECVDTRCILGKAILRIWPLDRISLITGWTYE